MRTTTRKKCKTAAAKEADSGKQAMVATTNGYAMLCSGIALRGKFEELSFGFALREKFEELSFGIAAVQVLQMSF